VDGKRKEQEMIGEKAASFQRRVVKLWQV